MHSFRTFAQRNVLPLLGIIPLLLSIATFVYDYYSDVDLTVQARVSLLTYQIIKVEHNPDKLFWIIILKFLHFFLLSIPREVS